MRREAEANAEADLRRKETIEARNQADNTIYTAEKMLREYGDKVPADVKTKIETGVNNLRQAMNSDNLEEIRSQTEALGREIQSIGASMYQQAGGPTDGGQANGGSGDKPGDDSSGEDVVDGEFRNA